MAIDQHAVCVDDSTPVPTWTSPEASESIPVQKWDSMQGRQVRNRDTAAWALNDCRWSLAH